MTVQRQNSDTELPEFPIRGPFGGIQSELPVEAIEKYGFADSLNMLYRRGTCRVRPALNSIPLVGAPPEIGNLYGTIASLTSTIADFPPYTGPVCGFADFFASNGTRLQVAALPTALYQYIGGAWSQVTGVLTGTATNHYSFAVVGQKLCFSQGVDPVRMWDGITAGFSVSSASAVPAYFLFELANHLIALRTVEGGSIAYQRLRWTGAGDPTDWTSFDAGVSDLFNDLGPINGGLKLFQSGYVWQQNGIVQMIPTGTAAEPFYLLPLSAKSKGLTCQYSLVANGESIASYVGKDNIYNFDGTSSTPIGDQPLQGRSRLGARSRIFADLMQATPNSILGFVTTSINGNTFNAYWLVIPNVSVWIYNYEEMNWARWSIAGNITAIGEFSATSAIRIQDLVGTIAAQLWTPATLTNNNPFDSVVLGFADGSAYNFDFTGWSEQPWSVTTGQLAYGDYRHEKTTVKTRLIYQDHGPATVNFSLTSDSGQVVSNTPTQPDGLTLGGINAGASITDVITHDQISGKYTTLQMSGAAGQPFEFSEVAPIYNPGGEAR